MLLNKNQILASQDRPFVDVEVPEWGGTVRVMAMSGTARDAWETSMFGTDGKYKAADNTRARLVMRCIVDETGALLFTSEAEVLALGSKSATALDRVFSASQKLNGLTGESVEEAVGNSNGDQPADSTSV